MLLRNWISSHFSSCKNWQFRFFITQQTSTCSSFSACMLEKTLLFQSLEKNTFQGSWKNCFFNRLKTPHFQAKFVKRMEKQLFQALEKPWFSCAFIERRNRKISMNIIHKIRTYLRYINKLFLVTNRFCFNTTE